MRVGDKVKMCRGRFAGKEGKIESVDLKRESLRVAGAEIVKKDGSKVTVPLHPSTLLLVELDLTDRRRKQKVESKTKSAKPAEDKKEGKKHSPALPVAARGSKNIPGDKK